MDRELIASSRRSKLEFFAGGGLCTQMPSACRSNEAGNGQVLDCLVGCVDRYSLC